LLPCTVPYESRKRNSIIFMNECEGDCHASDKLAGNDCRTVPIDSMNATMWIDPRDNTAHVL
jgi:hypothetical protein